MSLAQTQYHSSFDWETIDITMNVSDLMSTATMKVVGGTKPAFFQDTQVIQNGKCLFEGIVPRIGKTSSSKRNHLGVRGNQNTVSMCSHEWYLSHRRVPMGLLSTSAAMKPEDLITRLVSGDDWTLVNKTMSAPGPLEREGMGLEELPSGRLILFGGSRTDGTTVTDFNDIYYSDDRGETWIKNPADAPWAARRYFGHCMHNGKIYLSGGLSGSTILTFYDDVWESADGLTWIQKVTHAEFGLRARHEMVSDGTRLYVMFGRNSAPTGSPYLATIFHSNDNGATWFLTTQNPATGSSVPGEREGTAVVRLAGIFYCFGGNAGADYLRDVYSGTGTTVITWTRLADAPWEGRYLHRPAVFNSKIWLSGGIGLNSNVFPEVWTTTTCATWLQEASSDVGRFGHALVASADRLSIALGQGTGGIYYSSMRYRDDDPITHPRSGIYIHYIQPCTAWGDTLEAKQFVWNANTTVLDALDEVLKYINYVPLVKPVLSGSTRRPEFYACHEDEIDTHLDLPAPITITKGDLTVVDEPEEDDDRDELINWVHIAAVNTVNGRWYHGFAEAEDIDIIVDYYEELTGAPASSDSAGQAWAQTKAEEFLAFFQTANLLYTVSFVDRPEDFEVYQKVTFTGYDDIPGDTLRVVGMTHAMNHFKTITTLTLSVDTKFSNRKRLTRLVGSAFGYEQAKIQEKIYVDLSKMAVGKIGTIYTDHTADINLVKTGMVVRTRLMTWS